MARFLNRLFLHFYIFFLPFFIFCAATSAHAGVTVSAELNSPVLYPGDTMTLWGSIDKTGPDPVNADIYIKVSMPDGNDIYLVPYGTGFSATTAPLAANWPVMSVPRVQLLSFPLPAALPMGTYTWWIILDTPGSHLADNRRIIAQDSAQFRFASRVNQPGGLVGLESDYHSVSGDGTIGLTIAVNEPAAPASADVYLVIEKLDGTTYYMGPDGRFSRSSSPVPLLTNWQIMTVPPTELGSIPVPDELQGAAFTVKTLLVRPGGNPFSDSDLISGASEEFRYGPTVSPGDIAYCPPQSSPEACEVAAWPPRTTTGPDGTPMVIDEGYNPCGYDLEARDQYCQALDDNCNANFFPTQSLCMTQSYRESICGKRLGWCESGGLDRLCGQGSSYSFCYNFFNVEEPEWDGHGVTRPEVCDVTGVDGVEQACYEQWCSNEVTLYRCLMFPYRVFAYCATGTPDNSGVSYWPVQGNLALLDNGEEPFQEAMENLPGTWSDPSQQGSGAALSISPYFAQQFDNACAPLISEREQLCQEIRDGKKAIQPPDSYIKFFNLYESPLLAYDPVQKIPKFYPPRLYDICAFGQRFPEQIKEPPPLMVPFTEFFFDQLARITYWTRNAMVFRNVLDQSAGVYTDQVLAEVRDRYDLNRQMLQPLLRNFSTDMQALAAISSSQAVARAQTLPAASSGMIQDISIATPRALAAVWTYPQGSISADSINSFIDGRLALGGEEANANICSGGDSGFLPGDTGLSSCTDYAYNKYFSYTRLRDQMIVSVDPLEIVRFAYQPHIYALGWAAVHDIGVVRKNGEQVYRTYLEGMINIDDDVAGPGGYSLRGSSGIGKGRHDLSRLAEAMSGLGHAGTAGESRLDLANMPSGIADTGGGAETAQLTTGGDAGQGQAGAGETANESGHDLEVAQDGSNYIYWFPLSGQGIERNKNFFVELFSYIKQYNQENTDKDSFLALNILEDEFPAIMSDSDLLGLKVHENWRFYLDRLNDLDCNHPDFEDSDFDSYRTARLRLLELLIIRARIEKAVASLGITFSNDSDEENERIVANASTYTGTLAFLINSNTLSDSERAQVSAELAKPVAGIYKGLAGGAAGRGYSDMWAVGLDESDLVSMVQTPDRVLADLVNEIDREIGATIAPLASSHPECFNAAVGTCDWLPEHFVERVKGIVPDYMLNHDYETCRKELAGVMPARPLSEQERFNALDGYKFELAQPMLDHGISAETVCPLLNASDSDSTNMSGKSDRDYCLELSGTAVDYRSDTQALERFWEAKRFWEGTADAVGYYLLFKDNGIVDSTGTAAASARDFSSDLLFLGVSYSDYSDKGSEWLGITGGYGLGGGVAGLDKVLDDILSQDTSESLETNLRSSLNSNLKASLFGHVFSQLKLLTFRKDLFHFTLFTANKPGFNRASAHNFQPGIRQEVLNHGADLINGKKSFIDLEVLGKTLYSPDRSVSSDSECILYSVPPYNYEVNLVDKTFMVGPIPVRITAYGGVEAGVSAINNNGCAENWPEEDNSEILNISLNPSASVYGRMLAGVGFNAGVLSAIVGLEGQLDLMKNQLPITLVVTASSPQDEADTDGLPVLGAMPVVNFNNNIKHIATFGSGFVAVAGEVTLDLGPFDVTESFRDILYDFRQNPMWKREHKLYSLDGEYKTGQILKGMDYFRE